MALTANKIAVAMFGVAAGGYKAEIDAYMTANGETATVAALLPASGLNPTFLGSPVYNNQQFAEALVAKMMPGLPPTVASATASLIVNYMTANPTLSRAQVVVDLIKAIDAIPATDPTYGSVAAAFDNKVALADAYTGNSTDLNELAQVVGNQPPQQNQGQTFTLTDKLDSFTNVGSGTVNAVLSSTSDDTTWHVADQISGGTAGSTLNLTAVVGNHISTAGRSTSGIENFNITFADANTSAHTLTVDASTLTGAKNFTIVSATASNGDKVAFTGLAKSQNVTIKSADDDLNVELSYKTGEDSGASDVAALAVDGAKVNEIKVNGDFETVKVTGTGTSSVKKLNAANNKMTKLEIAGAGATTLSEVVGFSTTASKLTIDASAATGDVTVGVALSDKFDIKGGSGSDTIIATNTTPVNIGSSFKSTGVETILFKENGTGSALTHTINLTNATGVTTVGLRGSASSNADTVTFNNVADNITVLLQGDKTAANQHLGSVTVAVKNATPSAPANAVTIKVNNQGQDTGMTGSTENTIAVGTVTANNVKNITIDAADGDVSAFTLAANGLVSLTVKATEDFVFSSTVGVAAKTTTIDASQVAGKAQFTLTNNLEKDVTVTTGAGKDKVTLGDQDQNTSSNNTITINLGDGDDTLITAKVGASNSKTVLKVDLGAGNDTVVVTDSFGTGTHSIDFGDGTDTLKFEGSTNKDISTVTLENLEKVLLTGGGDLSVQAASFSGKSIEITTVGTGRLKLVGTNGADTIDASTLNIVGPNGVKIDGGAGADSITGSAGDDTIVGGAGADVMTGGVGNDRFVLTSGDNPATTITFSDVNSNTSIDNGDTITFNSAIDVIMDFTSGDKLDVATSNAVSNVYGTATTANLAANANAFVRGSWDSTYNKFTVNSAGADVLVVYEAANNPFTHNSQANRVVVLIGYNNDMAASDFV